MTFNGNAMDISTIVSNSAYKQYIFKFKNRLVVSIISNELSRHTQYNIAVYDATFDFANKFITDFFDTDSKIFQGTLITDCQNEIFKVLCDVSNYVKPATNGKPTL